MTTELTDAPADLDRLIQETIAELGMAADANQVADQVRRLNIGLPTEDEFAVVCGWLGKTRLLHKLDQQQSHAKLVRLAPQHMVLNYPANFLICTDMLLNFAEVSLRKK